VLRSKAALWPGSDTPIGRSGAHVSVWRYEDELQIIVQGTTQCGTDSNMNTTSHATQKTPCFSSLLFVARPNLSLHCEASWAGTL